MPAELWSSVILTCGGITFALVAVLAAKSAFKSALDGPAIRGRLAQLEARSEQHTRDIEEALGTAEKARRIASKREVKAKAAEVEQKAVEAHNGRRGRPRDLFDGPDEARPRQRTDDEELADLGDTIEELPE